MSSLILTISATKMPAPADRVRPLAERRNPPSRPPSCRGMKKSMLASREVNARMRMQSR